MNKRSNMQRTLSVANYAAHIDILLVTTTETRKSIEVGSLFHKK